MHRYLRLLLVAPFVFLVSPAYGYAQTIAAAAASKHVGQIETVCGTVAGTKYDAHVRGNPTFLDLGAAYPNQVFTVVIWGDDRGKFGAPEVTYNGKRICVTGLVRSYRGIPEIVVHDPDQVSIQ